MHRLRAAAFVATCLPVLATAQYPGAQPVPAEYKEGFHRITPEDAKKHLSFLAGPECQGRGTGQPGFYKAANYVASKFKEYGLKPVGFGGTYFQNVAYYATDVVKAESYLEAKGKRITIGDGWSVTRPGGTATATGKLVVLDIEGEGLTLDGLDLTGAIVVVRQAKSDKPVRTFGIRNAISAAKAAAIFFVSESSPQQLPQISQANRGRRSGGTISGVVSAATVERLGKELGLKEAKAGGTAAPKAAFLSDSPLTVSVKIETRLLPVPNVVGMIEGSDPTLKSQIVGVGAHLDHLGTDGTTVWPGADDDGSGSTAILEVAAAFQANKVKPRRSILFMAFCGEEMGLVGSGWYSDHPIFPHDRMIAELQMDMVGRDSDGAQNGDPQRMDKASENFDTIRLVGSKRISTELDATIQDLNKYVGFKFKYDAEDVYTRSDHYNFAKNGIPIAFLFDGFHPDYHQPTDTVEKINFLKLASSAKLYFMTALRLANNDAPPKKDAGR